MNIIGLLLKHAQLHVMIYANVTDQGNTLTNYRAIFRPRTFIELTI